MWTLQRARFVDHDSVGQQQVQGSSVMSGLCTTGCWLSSFMHLWSIGTSSGDWLVFGFMYASGSWLGAIGCGILVLCPMTSHLYKMTSDHSGFLVQQSQGSQNWGKKLQGCPESGALKVIMSPLPHFRKVKSNGKVRQIQWVKKVTTSAGRNSRVMLYRADTWVGVIHWDHTLLPAQS